VTAGHERRKNRYRGKWSGCDCEAYEKEQSRRTFLGYFDGCRDHQHADNDLNEHQSRRYESRWVSLLSYSCSNLNRYTTRQHCSDKPQPLSSFGRL